MCIPGCDSRSLKGKVVSSHGLGKPHLEIIEAEDNGRASRTADFRPNCLNGPTSLTSDKAWTSPNAALISLIGLACFAKNWIQQQLNMKGNIRRKKSTAAEHMCRMANVHLTILTQHRSKVMHTLHIKAGSIQSGLAE